MGLLDDEGRQPISVIGADDPTLKEILANTGVMARGFGYGVINPFHITSSMAKKYGGEWGQGFNARANAAMNAAPGSAGAGQALGLVGAGLTVTGALPESLAAAGARFSFPALFGAKLGKSVHGMESHSAHIDNLGGDAASVRDPGIWGRTSGTQQADDYIIARYMPKTPMSYPDTGQSMEYRGDWSGAVPQRALTDALKRQHDRTKGLLP